MLKIFITIILAVSIISGCAGIPGNNVSLKNYPDVTKEELQDVNVTFVQYHAKDLSEKKDVDRMKNNYQGKMDTGCLATKNINIRWGSFLTCYVGFFPSAFTATIFPYYCQTIYEAQSSLIYHPTKSETDYLSKQSLISDKTFDITSLPKISYQMPIYQTKKGNYIINTNKDANQTKVYEGDYFIDEEGKVTKLLKTYYLKDKVHEVWSLPWTLLVDLPIYLISGKDKPTPESAKLIVSEKVSTALMRSVLNDASKFEECKN